MSAKSASTSTRESKQKSKIKSCKRKRPKSTPSSQYQNECTDRYNKLHHTSSKLLHKEAKVVKSFECQKVVRSIKSSNESINGLNDEDAAKAKTRVIKLEQKLERTKKLDLDSLVSVGLKRLGVTSLDPKLNSDSEVGDEGARDDVEDDRHQSTMQDEDPFYQSLIESMLRHKRLSTVMDQINEKVSEYQQWMTRREEALLSESDTTGRGKKKKKKLTQPSRNQNDTLVVASQKRRKMDLEGHEGTSGLFIGSLSGQRVEGYSDEDVGAEYDAYEEDDDVFEKKKKNRPGQRARKAKAMAIEAKKAGRTWDSSVNWREKKDKTEEDDMGGMGRRDEGKVTNKRKRGKSGDGSGAAKAANSQEIATMGKSWKEDGKAHPSWAAAAAQKSQGIVEFKGTKITF